jgi:iron complex transport system ATP-binding protein
VSERLAARGVYAGRSGRAVLHDVTLTLHAGEALALVGPNAAGKSTLVRVLAGLLPIDSGSVTLEGKALGEWPRDALARMVALVAPDEEAPGTLTVQDRVALGRYPHRGAFRPFGAADAAATARALEQTGITHLARRRLATLSAGERQLAALARGLAQEPRVLLLDEPASHLDVGHQLRLFRALDGVRGCGVCVLAVVHDLSRAAGWAERMVLISEGRVTAEGTPADVLGSEAAARAFGVRIRAHNVPGSAVPLYSFEAGA